MSIATRTGDDGTTSLTGTRRVSKGHPRVEVCGGLDELVSQMGFARSICEHEETCGLLKDLQRQLFLVAEDVALGGSADRAPLVEAAHVDRLTAHVHRLESRPGRVLDWALPGEHPAAAVLDIARTVCRRTERALVRLAEDAEPVGPYLVPYLNRLSDLLWLLGREVEHAAGVDPRLRNPETPGPRWSRAW